MAYVSWIHAGSGNWTTNTDWSGGLVPTSVDDASIFAVSAITVTVSNGNSFVNSLSTGAIDTLSLTGGTLDILGSGNLAGAVKQSNSVSASKLIVAGQGTTIAGNFSQTAGTVVVQAGKLVLGGAVNSITGTISGGGWLTLDNNGAASTTTLNAGAALTVAHLFEQYGTLALGANIGYAGNYIQTGALVLNANTLTLSGAANIAGSIGTNGKLALAGAETLNGTSISGSTAIVISATTTLRGATVALGSAAGATANINVAVGGTLRLADDSGISTASASSKIQVSGALLKTGYAGESVISTQFANYSTIVPVGTITIAQGTLGLQGTSVKIGGLVNGAGTLAFDGYTSLATIFSGTTLNVASVLHSAGSLSVNAALSYAGAFVQTGGTLTVAKAQTLALTGSAVLQGGDVFGAATLTATSALLGGYLAIDNGLHLNLSGNSTQTGVVYIGDLANSAPTLDVLAAASYTLQSGSVIYGGPGNGIFVVAGTLNAVGPSIDYVYANTALSGSVNVGSGTLDLGGAANSLSGTLGGAGILQIDGTATLAAGSALSVAQLKVNGTLNVLGNETYNGYLNLNTYSAVSVAAGNTLTLGGPVVMNGTMTGGGVVATTGSIGLQGYYSALIDGSTTLSVAGVADQSGVLYLDYTAGSAAVLAVLAGATWNDHGASIYDYTASGTVKNAGTFAFDGGATTAQINANLVNTGVVQILTGDLDITGTVSGGGGFQIGTGATLEATGAKFDPAATVSFGGAAGELQVDGGGTFTVGVANFAGGNEIDLVSFSYPSAAALTLSGGVLTVSDGTNVANFNVGGGHSLADYVQQTDGTGGIAIFHT